MYKMNGIFASSPEPGKGNVCMYVCTYVCICMGHGMYKMNGVFASNPEPGKGTEKTWSDE